MNAPLREKPLRLTITNLQTKRLIQQYEEQLGLEAAQVIALAMRGKLPPLGANHQ